MNTVQEYLRLSSTYCHFLGGLRWSAQDDTIVYPDGTTFAFTGEIAAFLAGFGRQRRPIHFGHILHLLDLLRNSRQLATPEVVRLHRAFTETRDTFSNSSFPLSNAGTFFATACRDVPETPLEVDPREICDRLSNPAMPIRWFIVSFHDTFHPTEHAPLEPEALEALVLRVIGAYSDEELKHWFRHGRGPIREVGEEVARQLPVPRTLTGVLAALLERPRLAGAQAFVAQLVSALTLPPRRLAHQELPVGGYADVTTHGPVDQILPSQFALDEWDFFRRFAERELLYFRREEPQARTRQELVVLLDQGVRTWGNVRLVLGAAALAFGKQAARRGTPFFLAATSRAGDMIDPLQEDGEALGHVVEASDLSANPGLALERVLEQPAAGARDVVLLTHPRNLREADVCNAARRVAPGVRLFAVAMDATGRVDLSEMRHGAAVPLRHFQVDLSQPVPQPVVVKPEVVLEAPGPWRGDIEPIGFPFRFGVSHHIRMFDFDYAGDWLLTVSQDAMLHAWRTDGGEREILPRGMWQKRVLTCPEAALGVAGGFVVAERFNDQPVAFHYDFTRRTCTAHAVGPCKPGMLAWRYSREHHVVLRFPPVESKAVALDLTTGVISSPGDPNLPARVQAFWEAWQSRDLPGSRLSVFQHSSPGGKPLARQTAQSCCLDPETGQIDVHVTQLPWQPFIPLADGRPALKSWTAREALCCQHTLALMTSRFGSTRSELILRLFRGPEGIPLAEYPMTGDKLTFALSADGERLARLVGNYRVEVRRVAGDNAPILGTHAGGFSPRVRLLLGEGWLILRTGKHHLHLARWDRGRLELLQRQGKHLPFSLDAFYTERRDKPMRLTGVEGIKETVAVSVTGYDPRRFVVGAATDVLAVTDRFGQVAILDAHEKLIAMFFAFRANLAAWMPDGTRHGPASILGGPPTPDALVKIGRALQRASERRRTQS
jgi:hypothetical protein